jgi:hypothetical protein
LATGGDCGLLKTLWFGNEEEASDCLDRKRRELSIRLFGQETTGSIVWRRRREKPCEIEGREVSI